MKKVSKTLGAVALSAALAAGTALPAFAVEHQESGSTPTSTELNGDVPEGSKYTPANPNGHFTEESELTRDDILKDGESDFELKDDKDNVGSTDVSILAEVGQISATIPIKVSVVAQTTGGPLLASPSGKVEAHYSSDASERDFDGQGYRIENWSVMPIQVEKVQAGVNAGKQWTYEEAEILTRAQIADRQGALGDINLKIAPQVTEDADGNWKDATKWVLIGGASGATDLTADTNNSWSIAKGDDKGPNALGLKLWGSTSYINSRDALTDTNSKDIRLTFTIGIEEQA